MCTTHLSFHGPIDHISPFENEMDFPGLKSIVKGCHDKERCNNQNSLDHCPMLINTDQQDLINAKQNFGIDPSAVQY